MADSNDNRTDPLSFPICPTCDDRDQDGHSWRECTAPCLTCGEEHFGQLCPDKDLLLLRLRREVEISRVEVEKAQKAERFFTMIANLTEAGDLVPPVPRNTGNLGPVLTLFGVAEWIELWPSFRDDYPSKNSQQKQKGLMNKQASGHLPVAASDMLGLKMQERGKWPPVLPMREEAN